MELKAVELLVSSKPTSGLGSEIEISVSFGRITLSIFLPNP
jgi:hypothetical protein